MINVELFPKCKSVAAKSSNISVPAVIWLVDLICEVYLYMYGYLCIGVVHECGCGGGGVALHYSTYKFITWFQNTRE